MLPFFNEQELLKPSDLIHDTKEYPFSIIITWQRQILEAMARNYKLKEISVFRCGVACPVYEFKAKRESIGIVLLPIGAPVVAGFLEEYIVRNVMRFVCIGYAGSLSQSTGSTPQDRASLRNALSCVVMPMICTGQRKRLTMRAVRPLMELTTMHLACTSIAMEQAECEMASRLFLISNSVLWKRLR